MPLLSSTKETELVRSLSIPVGSVELRGDLVIPQDARALILFAHGSGSSRRSARNRFVAKHLRSRKLGTMLFDLLTSREDQEHAVSAYLRFAIPLLAKRLGVATDWMGGYHLTKDLPIGYFGASTGAAAALAAAAERPHEVYAVVSRGGRPDLASNALALVQAPTLLIVGGDDTTVLRLNRVALDRLGASKKLITIDGATHLFEEPGALSQVANLAGDWFVEQLAARGPSTRRQARVGIASA